MKEIKISSFKLNSRDELSFRVLIKKEDYTLWERELIKNAEINWDLLDFDIIWLVNWDIEKVRKEKLQRLNGLMVTYSEWFTWCFEDEKQNVYLRNKIKSRKDLTDSQLDQEIEIYLNWLKYE